MTRDPRTIVGFDDRCNGIGDVCVGRQSFAGFVRGIIRGKGLPRYVLIHTVALFLMLGSSPAMSQDGSTCAVLDPELQGKYAGGCVNGLADGQGQAMGKASYKGGFRAGRKHGKGVMTWASGDRYAGAGEDDVPVGPLTPAMMARARAAAERAAAVSKPGVRVCREMTVGVATRDWVRGTVTTTEAGRIIVRIDNPGQFQHVIANQVVRKGSVVRDSPQAWIPCL